MKPIEFKEQNCVVAKKQPEYLPLPAHKFINGDYVSCWKLSFMERFKLLFSKKLYVNMKTFQCQIVKFIIP